jgi:hypothetical protein
MTLPDRIELSDFNPAAKRESVTRPLAPDADPKGLSSPFQPTSRIIVLLLVVALHGVLILAMSNKPFIPDRSSSNRTIELSAFEDAVPVLTKLPGLPRPFFHLPKIHVPRFTQLHIEESVLPASSFAITVPAAERPAQGDTSPTHSVRFDSTALRINCAASYTHGATELATPSALEMLVRVESSGQLSDVKVARSSGSSIVDANIADCVLAHGRIENRAVRSESTFPIWQRVGWNDLN